MSQSGRTSETPPDPDQMLSDLAREWTARIALVNFIPGRRKQARHRLQVLLDQLCRCLTVEPFDPGGGYRVGADLVKERMTAPDVLGVSVELLSQRLLPTIGAGDDTVARNRLAALLGQVATGYTEALRDLAMDSAESISWAEKVTWRQQQRQLQQQVQDALLNDPVTGLGNRSWLAGQLTLRLADARPGQRIGVCVLRIPQVTTASHTLGPDKGDQLLQQVTRRLRPIAVDHGYLVGYLGGAEFAVTAFDTAGPEDMVKVADQLLRLLPPFSVDAHPFPGTAKAGLVEQPIAGADAAELLRTAGIALDWAMSERCGYALFDTQRGEADLRRHELTTAMPDALSSGQFYLDYQPLIRLNDHRIVGVEALARWHHPTLGPQRPATFISLAEQTGLIEPLGLHLLERACRQAAAWRRDRILLSVNLSPRQLAAPGLVAAVTEILDRTGQPTELLQLEITETGSLDTHHDALSELANLGIRLAIDDFGTGHSSLAYLSELPILTVKLAAQLLHHITEPAGTSRSRILSHLIEMCHDLDMQVTAEGIETPAQATHLTALGCDLGQGFHLARPTTPTNITRMTGR